MSIMPMIWVTYRKLSLGLRPVNISYRVNKMCPPSRAGIGMRFITPSMIDSRAMMLRKLYQSHIGGKICPMEMKLPSDLYASVLGVATSLRSWIYSPMESNVFTNPAGMADARLYSLVFTSGLVRYTPSLPVVST